jgi:hypothetical protein
MLCPPSARDDAHHVAHTWAKNNITAYGSTATASSTDI